MFLAGASLTGRVGSRVTNLVDPEYPEIRQPPINITATTAQPCHTQSKQDLYHHHMQTFSLFYTAGS
eukprot:scaffold1005_cov70-Cyclotella_meneghiniana.AAC.3